MKTLQEAKIGETLQSGVSSVKNKLNDPNFQKDVKDKAEAGWSWLSSTAGSLWSAAKEAASQIASDLNEPAGNVNKHNSSRPAGGVSTSTDVSELTVSPQHLNHNYNNKKLLIFQHFFTNKVQFLCPVIVRQY